MGIKRINLRKHGADIARELRRDRFNIGDQTRSGIIHVCHDALAIAGGYVEGIKGQPESFRYHPNLVVTGGVVAMLNIMLGSTSKISAWYMGAAGGSGAPAANWTGANWASNATEITDDTDLGYSEATRPVATFANASGVDQIDNYGAPAEFSIVVTEEDAELEVFGLGILQSSVRGGTTGVLFSAVKFGVSRKLQNGDTWLAGYRVVVTPT